MNRVDTWFLSTEPQEINLDLGSGGMGDQVCRLPAIRALLTTYPHVTVHCYCPSYWVPVLDHFLGRFPRLVIYPKDDGIANYPQRAGYWFAGKGDRSHTHTTLGTHLIDYTYNILLDRVPNPDERNYLQIKVETKAKGAPYAVLTPGFTSNTRSLPGYTWNSIAKYLMFIGVTPVWLGRAQVKAIGAVSINFDTDIDFTVGQDMRDKTTVLEAAMIMSQAKMVIGLDNGLIHVAALSDVPIIAAYSSVKPLYRLPIRHGELGWGVYPIVPDTCHGCENIIRFDYQADFRECRYEDYICTKELTFDKFRVNIDQVMEKQNG